MHVSLHKTPYTELIIRIWVARKHIGLMYVTVQYATNLKTEINL